MTFLAERVAELRSNLDHLRRIRPRVVDRTSLESDRTLRNDVLFSLLVICQLVIDIAADRSAKRAERFDTYRDAIRNLARDDRFPSDVVNALDALPGFRNVLVHEYLAIDYDLVMEALDHLEPVERFVEIVARELT